MNCIFQYMVANEETDKRGKVKEYPQGPRSELYRRTADLSAKSFRIYSDKIGCDHHYSTKQVYTKNFNGSTVLLFECLRMIYDTMYDKYDKVAFIDSDIICNTEENVFDVCGDYDVSGILESEIRTAYDGGYNAWDFNEEKKNELLTKYRRNDLPAVPTKPPLRPSCVTTFNTGVMIWSKEGRLKAREMFDPWYSYMMDGDEHGDPNWLNNDQPWLSAQIMKYGLSWQCIDQKWNDTPTHWNDGRGYNPEHAYFLHYTGGGNKVVMLNDYKEGKFSYLKP